MNAADILLRPGRPKDAAKRDEIVSAATQLFMQNGFGLTSMEAVARQAGVSKLTIYSHFADKNELFRAIIQNRCDRLCMPDSFTTLASLPPDQSLCQIASHVARLVFSDESVSLQRVIYAEASRHPELVQIFYEIGPLRVKTAFADLLRLYNQQGALAIPDVARATEQFFSLLKGERLLRVIMMLSPLPDEAERDAHVTATVSFFLSAHRPLAQPVENP